MGNRTTSNKTNQTNPSLVAKQPHRVAVIGDEKVGKTALITQFTDNLFEGCPVPDDYLYNKRHYEHNGIRLNTLINDMFPKGEDDVYQNKYWQRCEGILLVYDVTNKLSFEKCSSLVDNVLMLKSENERGIPVILVGNKIDLDDERQVSTAEGEELAKQNGWNFFETSAKERINVEEAFGELIVAINGRKVPIKRSKTYL